MAAYDTNLVLSQKLEELIKISLVNYPSHEPCGRRAADGRPLADAAYPHLALVPRRSPFALHALPQRNSTFSLHHSQEND